MRGDDDVEETSPTVEAQLRTLMAQVETQARDSEATRRAMDEMKASYERSVQTLQTENEELRQRLQNPEYIDEEEVRGVARDGAADTAVAPTATKKVAQEAGPSKGKAFEKATTQAGSVAEGKNDPSAEWKKQMMEEMMQKVNQLGTYGDMTEQVIRGVTQSPFTEWISDEPKPKDFVVPTMQSFDGSSDLVDHLYQFQQKMAIETKSEALSCKAFSTTLSGPAMM